MPAPKDSFIKAVADKRPWLLVPTIAAPFFLISCILLAIYGGRIPYEAFNRLMHIGFWGSILSIFSLVIFFPFSAHEMKERFGIEITPGPSPNHLTEQVDYSTDSSYQALAGNIGHKLYVDRHTSSSTSHTSTPISIPTINNGF